MHFCEVMIKDIADSKRINTHIVSQIKKSRVSEDDTMVNQRQLANNGVVFIVINMQSMERPELNAFILSHVFWPTFREEKLKLPNFIQRLHNNCYCHTVYH